MSFSSRCYIPPSQVVLEELLLQCCVALLYVVELEGAHLSKENINVIFEDLPVAYSG